MATNFLDTALIPVPAGLIVSPAMLQELEEHLRLALPNEGCALLATTETPDGNRLAMRLFPGTNIDASPTRYTMDFAEVAQAFAEIDAEGWQLGAIAHSHPSTEAAPSPTDHREAFYPDALLVIVSFAKRHPVTQAWSISTSQSIEVPIVLAGSDL